MGAQGLASHTSSNSKSFLSFCKNARLKAANSFFRHKPEETITWIHPKTNHGSVKDWLLCNLDNIFSLIHSFNENDIRDMSAKTPFSCTCLKNILLYKRLSEMLGFSNNDGRKNKNKQDKESEVGAGTTTSEP